MMKDKFNRNITYLRISVTDRCNLKCSYCIPKEGIKLIPAEKIISFEEIIEVINFGIENGISKIRLTGGEPLVRKNIESLIHAINKIKSIEEIALTTNGILLKDKAYNLARAGLKRVNISIDTMDKEEYFELTHGGNVEDVLEGINAARQAGLNPVKLNIVKFKNKTMKGLPALLDYAKKNGLETRFINQMDLQKGEFSAIEGGNGGICSFCNRLRLTSAGDIKPCLFSELSFNIRELGIQKAFNMALSNKPKKGTINRKEEFIQIGG